jgi:hypothetical protein
MIPSVSAFVLFITAAPALAQTLPPTPQQLQQQHDQAVQNESNNIHNSLNQTGAQIQQQAQQPYLSRSGRPIAHPPGYIPMPGR